MKKQINLLIHLIVIMCVLFSFMSSCKKDDDNSSTIKDIDGNAYHTVTIGTQTWMVENLKVTHYRNGDPIPEITEYFAWGNMTTGAYCNYDNSPDNSNTYGRLYNWYAVNDIRGLAPAGWHVPSDAEWDTLTAFLGGESVAGGKLKETGTSHWKNLNIAETNEYGFTALPGGHRDSITSFVNMGVLGYWWSSSHADSISAFSRYLLCSSSNIFRYSYAKNAGFSVRCIKD